MDLSDFKVPKTDAASSCKKKSYNDSDNNSNSDQESAFEEYHSASENSRALKVKNTRKRARFHLIFPKSIIRKGIKTRTQLLAYANQQKLQGKSDRAEFIVNQGPRVVAQVLTTAWEMNMMQINWIILKYWKKHHKENVHLAVMDSG